MKVKRTILVTTGTLLCLTNFGWAKEDLPVRPKFARYEPMVKRSPFAIATAGAPIASAPDFAKELYIANAAHSPDGDFVTLASTTDKNLKEYLNTKETINGYTVSSIQWSDKVGETKVTISKNGQFATLTFNEALLSQAIQNPAPAVVQPPVQPANGNVTRPQVPIQRPMPVPQIPTPQPHTRPIIRRNTPNRGPVHQPQPEQRQTDEDSGLDES
jgi:hypothetical protein